MTTRTKTTAAGKPAATATRGASAAKAKTPAARKTVKPPVPKAAHPALAPAPAPEPVVTERARRGDLLDALAERSPMRRADLKVMMELVLEEMGKLIDDGDEIVLPPLGKLTVKKRVERPGGDMLTIKLKRLTPERPEH